MLNLDTLMLQKVGGLAKNLHTLRTLKGAILSDHALMLVWVGEVRDVLATSVALADLHLRLLRLDTEL